MPLQPGTDPHVVAANVEELISAGHPVRQAVAIAHSFARRPPAPLGVAREFADRAARWHETSRTRADAASFAGIPVVVESPAGTFRHWAQQDGRQGSTLMRYDYGYFRDSTGADGEGVDVYLGPDPTADTVYVVHQMAAPEFSQHDEDKVMAGFSSPEAARTAYMSQYDDPRFFGSMTAMPVTELKRRLGHDVTDLRDDPESLAAMFTRQVCDYHTRDTASRTGTAHILSPRVASSAALQAEAMLRSSHTADEARAVAHGHVDELWTQLGFLWGQQLTGAATRVDEWDESQHPRASDGRFGEGDAHAVAAEGHAATAKAAASGTTPAARASARKAAEHAALARVAAQHFNAVGAEHHAAEAARHSLAAQMKATAHVQSASVSKLSVDRPQSTPPKGVRVNPIPTVTLQSDNQITPDHQKAIRDAFDAVAEKALGLTRIEDKGGGRTNAQGHVLEVRTSEQMGGAFATRGHDGRVVLSEERARGLAEFSSHSDPRELGKQIAALPTGDPKRTELVSQVLAYGTLMHETVHGYGPKLLLMSKAGLVVEEISTELVAKHAALEAVGLTRHQMPEIMERGYPKAINDLVDRVVKVTGAKDRDQVIQNLERASLAMKRSTQPLVDHGHLVTEALAAKGLSDKDRIKGIRAAGIEDEKRGVSEILQRFTSGIDVSQLSGRTLSESEAASLRNKIGQQISKVEI